MDDELLARIERRLNTQEALISQLFQAYMEMWATVEVMMGEMMGTRSAEEREAFLVQYKDIRTQLWGAVKEAGEAGIEGLDPELATALEKLVKGE